MFYPFHYTDDDWIDLRGLAIQQYPDPAGQLCGWPRAFVTTVTLSLLKDLNAGVSGPIAHADP